MRTGFRNIFWGLILTFLGINIGTFDILPDFLGYYLIYSGCKKLAYRNEAFKKGSLPSLILIGLSFLSIFNVGDISLMGIIIGLATRIIDLVLAYYIFKGIYNIAEEVNNIDIKSDAKFRWNLLLYLSLLVEFLGTFSYNTNFTPMVISIFILGLAIFIIKILYIALVNRASKEFLVE